MPQRIQITYWSFKGKPRRDTTETYFVICISTQASQPTKNCLILKVFLGMCGIDVTTFTAHSTRSASISRANNMDLSIKGIQKAAGWSGDSTFCKYCNLPVLKNFGSEIVNRFKNNWKTWLISGVQISFEYLGIEGNLLFPKLNKWNAVWLK